MNRPSCSRNGMEITDQAIGAKRARAAESNGPGAAAIRVGLAALLLLPCLLGTSLAGDLQSHESIRAAGAEFLRTQARALHGGEPEVQVNRLDPRLRLTACAEPLETFLPNAGRTLGTTSVGVRCLAPKPWTLYVPAKISLAGNVVVAARALARGEKLQAGDVKLVKRDLAGLSPGYATEPAAVVGQRLKRAVTVGTPLGSQMLEVPVLVRRGQRVTVLAQGRGIQVRTSGKALGDATEGELVRVENPTSRRVVEGVAVAEGVVRVNL